jgi:hypothetical protein
VTSRHTLDRYYSELIDAAADAEAHAINRSPAGTEPVAPDPSVDADQARRMLTAIAEQLRGVAGIFDQDPSLRDEPDSTGLGRGLALLPDLARSAIHMIRAAQSRDSRAHDNSTNHWAEAVAITDRVDDLAERIRDALPRPDYDTIDDARRISRARLAAGHDDLTAAADLIDSAVTAALRVPHPDSDAVELAALADSLRLRAASLAEHHHNNQETIAHALGLRP